nr:hypothetical protein [uncultured Roseateles sp.]
MGYKPELQAPATASDGEPGQPWVPPGMGMPPSQEFREATTTDQAIAAAERMFFGDVKNVEQI